MVRSKWNFTIRSSSQVVSTPYCQLQLMGAVTGGVAVIPVGHGQEIGSHLPTDLQVQA